MKSFFRFVLPLLFISFFAQAKSKPDTVKAGAFIISIHDINFHDMEYTARFWLWFVYDNPELDFSKSIDITNAKDINISSVSVDTVNGKYWAQMKMECTMKENWSVHNFPFDKQHLRIIIEDEALDINNLVFVADTIASQFSDTKVLGGWIVDNFRVHTSESKYNTSFGNPEPGHDVQNFSRLTIGIKIEREAWGLFFKIFLGMYFAFLISLVSFLSDTNELEPRFGLPVGGLFAAVGNKYVIDSILPETSLFTLADILHNLTFFGIFGMLTVSAIALRLHDHEKIDAAHRVSKVGVIVVIAVYLIGNFYYIATA